jgi:uncharacterized coiled-coil DUF342 family protein
MKWLLITVLAAALSLSFGCSNDSGSSGNAPEATVDSTADERREFIDDAEAKLDKLRDRADELSKKADNVSTDDARAEINEQIDGLQGRIADAEARLKEVRDSSGDEWKKRKDDAEEALRDAEDIINKMAEKLGL